MGALAFIKILYCVQDLAAAIQQVFFGKTVTFSDMIFKSFAPPLHRVGTEQIDLPDIAANIIAVNILQNIFRA